MSVFCARAQMYLGFKVGGSYNQAQYRDKGFLEDNQYDVQGLFAYQGGIIAHYRVTTRWAFRTELNYVRRGREITRGGTNYIHDRAYYNYADLPFLFRVSFPIKNSALYVQGGPHINYFIGGKVPSPQLLLEEEAEKTYETTSSHPKVSLKKMSTIFSILLITCILFLLIDFNLAWT